MVASKTFSGPAAATNRRFGRAAAERQEEEEFKSTGGSKRINELNLDIQNLQAQQTALGNRNIKTSRAIGANIATRKAEIFDIKQRLAGQPTQAQLDRQEIQRRQLAKRQQQEKNTARITAINRAAELSGEIGGSGARRDSKAVSFDETRDIEPQLAKTTSNAARLDLARQFNEGKDRRRRQKEIVDDILVDSGFEPTRTHKESRDLILDIHEFERIPKSDNQAVNTINQELFASGVRRDDTGNIIPSTVPSFPTQANPSQRIRGSIKRNTKVSLTENIETQQGTPVFGVSQKPTDDITQSKTRIGIPGTAAGLLFEPAVSASRGKKPGSVFINEGTRQAAVDIGEGLKAPAEAFGRSVIALPEGFRREFTGQLGVSGQKFFEEEVAPTLPPTKFESFLTGRPTGRSPTYDVSSIIGEGIFFAPFIPRVGRGPKARSSPKNIGFLPASEKLGGRAGKSKLFRPSNPYRRGVPSNVFERDIIEPSIFSSTRIGLGTGVGGKGPAPPKTGPSDLNKALFGTGARKTKGGGTFEKKTFTEPKVSPGDKTISKGGLTQILKQKPVSQQKSVLKLEPKVKQKTLAQIKTENFFKVQSRQAKKRQASALKNVQRSKQGQLLIPKLKPTQKQLFKSPPKQKQKLRQPIPPLFRQSARLKQPPRQKTTTILPPFVPTRTTLFPPTQRPPRTPPRRPIIGGLPFFFQGGRRGGGGRRPKGFRSYSIWNVNPDRAGVISQEGVPTLTTGRTTKIFSRIERRIKKAGRKSGRPGAFPVTPFDDPIGKPGKKKTDIKFSFGKTKIGF